MAKRSQRDAGGNASSPQIKLTSANPVWLHAERNEKFLLLEDPETGDMLMPLIYMKPILEANYSRKLAALKHRQVTVPAGSPLSDKAGLLYWQWAFEAPLSIKAIVRRELGDENTPQGHLRLVLVPIVFNAMAQREDLHAHPLFVALHKAMRTSTYWPLVIAPATSVVQELDAAAAATPAKAAPEAAAAAAAAGGGSPLFKGPFTLEATALKYMFLFKDHEEVEQSKKARTTGTALQQEGAAIVEAAMRRSTQRAAQPGLSASIARTASLAGPGNSTIGTDSDQRGQQVQQQQQGAAAAAAAAAGGGVVVESGLWQPPPSQPSQLLQPPLLWLPQQPAAAAAAEPPPQLRQQQLRQPASGLLQQHGGGRGGGGGVDIVLEGLSQLPPHQQQQLVRQLVQSELQSAQAQSREQEQQQQLLLLLQVRQALQQELLPSQQQLEALTEEVASLRRCVGQLFSLLSPGSQDQQPPTASQLQMPAPPPTASPFTWAGSGGLHKPADTARPASAQRQQAGLTDPMLAAAAAAAADSQDLRQLLQQQLGYPWPGPDFLAQGAPDWQAQAKKASRAGQGGGEPAGFHLASPLASLNFLLDQIGSRPLKDAHLHLQREASTGGFGSLRPLGPAAARGRSPLPAAIGGGGGRPPAPLHRSRSGGGGMGGILGGGLGDGSGGGGGLGPGSGTNSVDTLATAAAAASAADAGGAKASGGAAAAAAAAAPAAAHGGGAGGGGGEGVLDPVDLLALHSSALLLPDSSLNWSQLLTELGTGRFELSLQALTQSNSVRQQQQLVAAAADAGLLQQHQQQQAPLSAATMPRSGGSGSRSRSDEQGSVRLLASPGQQPPLLPLPPPAQQQQHLSDEQQQEHMAEVVVQLAKLKQAAPPLPFKH